MYKPHNSVINQNEIEKSTFWTITPLPEPSCFSYLGRAVIM